MNKNLYAKFIFLLAICCLCLSSLFLWKGKKSSVSIQNGFLDLSGQNLSEEKYTLDGEWEFYKDGYYKEFPKEHDYILVPKAWNSEANEKLHMSKYGQGTYRLCVKLPKSGAYMLHLPFIPVSYELYVNGDCIAKEGVLQDIGQPEVDRWNPQNVMFYTETKEAEIVIYVSNHVCKNAGIIYSLVLGSYEKMYEDTLFEICRSAVFVGIFVGFGLYLMLLYRHKVNKKCLYLGTFCGCCVVLEGFIGTYINSVFFQTMHYRTMIKMEYAAFIGGLLTLTLLFHESYLKRQCKSLFLIVLVVDLSALMLMTAPIYTGVRIVGKCYCGILATNAFYILFSIIKGIREKAKYTILSMVSLVVLVATVSIDVFGIVKITSSFSRCGIYVVGVIFFIICQMYILSLESLDIYEQSNKAKDMEIAFLQAQIAPHFFFNTLNHVYTLIENNKEAARKLLTDLCSFLRVKYNFDYRKNVVCSLYQEIDLIATYINIENVRFNHMIQLQKQIDHTYDNMRIPQLLLQPLVENAIKHGFRNELLTITIIVKKKEDTLMIKVCDDGRGIGKGYIATILSEQTEHKGVGLQNVNNRLQKCYHTNLEINSKVGIGTEITVRIPLKELESNK